MAGRVYIGKMPSVCVCDCNPLKTRSFQHGRGFVILILGVSSFIQRMGERDLDDLFRRYGRIQTVDVKNGFGMS